MAKDFKYPVPKQPFIHGRFVDAKGPERVSLYSAIDDSLVCDGTDGHLLQFQDIEHQH